MYHIDPRVRALPLLPSSLDAALTALRGDDVILAALGPHIAERFLEAKQAEWDDYSRHVSQWELDRYLALY